MPYISKHPVEIEIEILELFAFGSVDEVCSQQEGFEVLTATDISCICWYVTTCTVFKVN
jgi:hypothetical protein